MPQRVTFTVPTRQLGNSAVEFKVRRDGEIFGTLKVYKGRIVWVPKNAQKGHRLDWTTFADLMEQHGKKEP